MNINFTTAFRAST